MVNESHDPPFVTLVQTLLLYSLYSCEVFLSSLRRSSFRRELGIPTLSCSHISPTSARSREAVFAKESAQNLQIRCFLGSRSTTAGVTARASGELVIADSRYFEESLAKKGVAQRDRMEQVSLVTATFAVGAASRGIFCPNEPRTSPKRKTVAFAGCVG